MLYTGDYLKEISFPIGGIGTGSFGISGNGSFVDWEIFNRPAKGRNLRFSHIAVKAKTENKTIVKILNGDITQNLTGTYNKSKFCGFGFGPDTGRMCGMPHFRSCRFEGEFPIAKLTFSDDDFPADVVMTAFNPFIPLDSDNSSLPVGMFNIEFINKTNEDIEFTAVFSLSNPFESSINRKGDGRLTLSTTIDKEDLRYGDMSVITDCKDNQVQQYWYRGAWNDNLDVFITELRNNDKLTDRFYEGEKLPTITDVGSLLARKRIGGNCSDSIRFVISWNKPNCNNYWTAGEDRGHWKNYYATVYPSSVESGEYCIKNFDSLYNRTKQFKDALFNSSLDSSVIDAISSTMSVLKSPTVLRLQDGSFYGWEGVHENEGSCEGTCQHVWNYAYALCFLFPDLERSIRENEFKYSLTNEGGSLFRISLPLGSEQIYFHSCVDGQMGTIIKTYREWKLSGDNEWLKRVFPTVKILLEYAWSDKNKDQWDLNKDGVLEGRQHHTLDMELFGPSAWLQGFYLTALKAAAEMAEFLGEYDKAEEYLEIFQKGYEYTKNNLFNGEYFIQEVDLSDKAICDKFDCQNYWYDEAGEIKYQIANGCEIDQVLAQWHANICGLGEIFDNKQLTTALNSLYKYNFRKSMRDYFNTWRIFSLNDEGGAVICTYPNGSPTIPIPYHSETMTGFEYALAGLMISEGMEKEGLEIVKAIRDRYDGKKRNPWNEIECGSNYARAMASFALIPIYSGLSFDLPHNKIGFNPIHKENFNCIFSIGTAWGILEWSNRKISVIIKEGYLNLEEFAVNVKAESLFIDGVKTDFCIEDNSIKFKQARITDSLVVMI